MFRDTLLGAKPAKGFKHFRSSRLHFIAPRIGFNDRLGFPGQPRLAIPEPNRLLKVRGNRGSEIEAEAFKRIFQAPRTIRVMKIRGGAIRVGRKVPGNDAKSGRVPSVIFRDSNYRFHCVVGGAV